MPIYEYRCKDCSHSFQLLQSVGSRGEGVICPSCGGTTVEPLVSAFASTSSDASMAGAGCGPAPT
jgi:putative FmdB family regulatory protein